jgi:cell wall-associated NlpC family hydrolase
MTPVSRSAPVAPAISVGNAFDKSLLGAIQSHLGADYHFNRTGPDEFDCSGLVWRAFQDVGVDFQRGPARSYWATFEVPTKEDQYKFGTLVFFSNLSHVGIVVDEKGFYHSARHGGVMYSPFNDYWLSRVDGFRRVPSQSQSIAAKAKPVASKPATAAVLEQNNQR